MIRYLFSLLALSFAVGLSFAADKESRVFELRVYTPSKGKQSAVNALIAKSGAKYMAKHHIELLGAWVPADATDERVLTLVAHKDKESGAKNWEAFRNDEGWKADLAESSKDGRAVGSIANFFLSATDYSPAVKAATVGGVFELRTYAASPNNLANLNARFRNHTLKLFEKHGMTNLAYFNLGAAEKTTCDELLKALSPLGKDAAEVKGDSEAKTVGLVYFLSHKSAEAMKKSFDDFRVDDAWKTAMADSEKNAGGSLTAKNGVKSLLLKATDYSPIK